MTASTVKHNARQLHSIDQSLCTLVRLNKEIKQGYIHSAVVEAIADIAATILHKDNNKIGANASYDKLRAIFHYT